MITKLAVTTLGIAAGLVAAAPLASAHEAPDTTSTAGHATQSSSDSSAVQAPVEEGSLAGVLDGSDNGLVGGHNAHSFSGNGTVVNGHDLSS